MRILAFRKCLKEIYRKGDRVDIRKLRQAVISSNLDATVKCDFLDYLAAGKDTVVEAFQRFAYDFFGAEEAIGKAKKCRDMKEWSNMVIGRLTPSVQGYGMEQAEKLLALILPEQCRRDNSYGDLVKKFVENIK